ncbi:MAG: DUF975 family protein [Anaerovoracaceae bacterium]
MENHIIVTEDSKNLRALGLEALRGNWKQAVVVTLVYMVIVVVPPMFIDAIFGQTVDFTQFMNVLDSSGNYTYSFGNESLMTKSTPLSGVYVLLISGPMAYGITVFFMSLFRKTTSDMAQLFVGFERFGKTLGLSLWIALWVFLWLLIPIAGLVLAPIAAIKYSQAYFVMADNPNLSIRECLNESKRLMNGNKAKYFCLCLSFIGWGLLACVPVFLLSGLGVLFGLYGLVLDLYSLLISAGFLWVFVYMYSTEVGFYDILTGKLKGDTYTPGEY